MLVAGKLAGVTTFPTRRDVDLVDQGFCGLTLERDQSLHWKMEEPLVLDVISAELDPDVGR